MWGTLISWAGQFGLGTIAKYLGYAVAAAVIVWLWNDYQERGEIIARQHVRIEQQAATHQAEMEAGFRREEQLRADLVLQKEVADERLARSEKLSKWISEMKTIQRRPEHAICPETGPAVSFAFDRLRSDAKGTGAAD